MGLIREGFPLEHWFLTFSVPQSQLDGLFRLLGITPRVYDLLSLDWGPIISISNKFPDADDAINMGFTL